MKEYGIIGSGIVAKTLAKGLTKYGNDVMLGTRNPDKLEDWREAELPTAKIGSFAEAADFGQTIVLAAKGSVVEELLSGMEASIKGKTIIDATNPISDAAPEAGVLKFFTSLEDSLMERLQRKYPEANFVKAFNSIGSAFMVNPHFEEGKPSMFICGNDAKAKAEVTALLDQFGFETEDMGSVEAARAIEPLCILWCIPGFNENKWSHAFKLLKK